jgi:hypothetical protein
MPDLQSLCKKYRDKGLIMAISDDDASKVKPFVSEPILVDPFVYDRDGKLVAQSIDMRTKRLFQEMLALADLK